MLSRFFSSSIGLKIIMALTGVALIGFIVGHLLGNLQVFLGQDAFNAYAYFLKSKPALIWGSRAGLIVFLLAHIFTAIKLRLRNKGARKEGYRKDNTVQATAASRYMMQSGMVILIFIVIHLLHFTVGTLQPENYSLVDPQGRHDVYSMLVLGFQNVSYSVGYIVALLCLGAHLSHAIASFFQTLGLTSPAYEPMIKKGACGLSAALILGYIAIPVSVLLGLITLPPLS